MVGGGTDKEHIEDLAAMEVDDRVGGGAAGNCALGG